MAGTNNDAPTPKVVQLLNVQDGSWVPSVSGQSKWVSIPAISGHKYLGISDVYTPAGYSGNRVWALFLQSGTIAESSNFGPFGEWKRLALIGTASSSSDISFQYLRNEAKSDFVELKWRNVMAFDLTEAFGEGNEPSTPDDFAHRLGFPSINELPYIKPAWPFPTTPLAFRAAALLTYANETTGAGDTLLGDAVKTLVEGYGGGEPVDDWNYLLRDARRGSDGNWGPEVYDIPDLDNNTMIEICLSPSMMPISSDWGLFVLALGGNTARVTLRGDSWETLQVNYSPDNIVSRGYWNADIGLPVVPKVNTTGFQEYDIVFGIQGGIMYVNGIKVRDFSTVDFWNDLINTRQLKIGEQERATEVYIKYIRYKQINP